MIPAAPLSIALAAAAARRTSPPAASERRTLVTIVPPKSTGKGFTVTNGTKVLLPNGTELKGVTGIRLIGHSNDVWRAEIECIAHVDEMPGMLASIRTSGKRLSLWQRVLLRLSGLHAIAVETLDSDSDFQEWKRFRLRRVPVSPPVERAEDTHHMHQPNYAASMLPEQYKSRVADVVA